MAKIPVALFGASGSVGHCYRALLKDHPLFNLKMTPSRRDMSDHADKVLDQVATQCRVVFSALPTAIVRTWDEALAARGLALFSMAAHHRLAPDVPLLIPEINPDHLEVLAFQKKRRSWGNGCLIAKPNCTLQSYLLPLFPLHRAFEVTDVMVTTLQATSGAGKGFALTGNVIPFIEDEEEKSEREPLKILGSVGPSGIELAGDIALSVQCNRVPVPMGHLACISVAFRHAPHEEEIKEVWRAFRGAEQTRGLPSAPAQPVVYLEARDRPQPQLDVERAQGMAATVGRLRRCPVLDFRFTALTHNLVRGAAGGSLFSAELAHRQGWF